MSKHALLQKWEAIRAECARLGINHDELTARAREVYREFQRAALGEATRAAMAAKKRAGRKHCRDAAGYGFVFRGRRGHEKLVPHAGEQQAIARIMELRESGLSWYKIALRLLYDRVRTKDGAEWSPSRVRRVYLAELQRRAASA